MKDYGNRFLALFVASAGIGAGLFSFLNKERLNYCFSNTAYYLILLLFIFWLVQLILNLKKEYTSLGDFFSQNRAGLLLALALTLIVSISVPSYFRVLSDETNLLSVSKSMTYERNVDNVTMGKWYYHNFNPLNREFEKRPLLFPFFLHIVHTVSGYRPENAFALNAILLFSLLSLVFSWVRTQKGNTIAGLTLLFIVSQPVIVQTSASGGFDLLYVLFATLCFHALYHFMENSTPDRFLWLWINLLMLINTRYESAALAASILLLLLTMGYLHKRSWTPLWQYGLTPILLLPRLWQFGMRTQIHSLMEAPDQVAAFSWKHFLHHNKIFSKSLADFHFLMPYATVLNWLGIAGLLYVGFKLAGKSIPKIQRDFLHIVFFTLALLWILVNSFHIGDVSHPASARYFTLFYLTLAVAAALFVAKISAAQTHISWLTGIAVGGFLLYHPLSVENRFSNQLLLPREYRMTMDFFKKLGTQNILIIADRPGQYTVANYGAVNFEVGNEQTEELLNELNRHLFRDIYVIQEIQYASLSPTADTTLDPRYKLKPELEFQNKAESFIRISRVLHSA